MKYPNNVPLYYYERFPNRVTVRLRSGVLGHYHILAPLLSRKRTRFLPVHVNDGKVGTGCVETEWSRNRHQNFFQSWGVLSFLSKHVPTLRILSPKVTSCDVFLYNNRLRLFYQDK